MVKATMVEGVRKVYCPQHGLLHEACNIRLTSLTNAVYSCICRIRSGGKDITSSSAYPINFGKRVCELHN